MPYAAMSPASMSSAGAQQAEEEGVSTPQAAVLDMEAWHAPTALAAAEAGAYAPMPDAPIPAPSASHAHILIVDDEDDLRDTMRELLELYGFRIDTAANGQQALDSLKRDGLPCMIMLDLMMPVMNGWTFLRELAALGEPYCSVPVAIVSAAADLPAISGSLDYPMFPKPTDINALVSFATAHCAGRP